MQKVFRESKKERFDLILQDCDIMLTAQTEFCKKSCKRKMHRNDVQDDVPGAGKKYIL